MISSLIRKRFLPVNLLTDFVSLNRVLFNRPYSHTLSISSQTQRVQAPWLRIPHTTANGILSVTNQAHSYRRKGPEAASPQYHVLSLLHLPYVHMMRARRQYVLYKWQFVLLITQSPCWSLLIWSAVPEIWLSYRHHLRGLCDTSTLTFWSWGINPHLWKI